MVDNPFETASTLVGDLQKQYDELVKAIPKLKVTKQAVMDQLKELNKRIVKAQKQLETLNEQITTNTTAYNTWQRGELAKLATAKKDFADLKEQHENDTGKIGEQLGIDAKAIEQAQKDLEAGQTQLATDQKEVNDQAQVNAQWAKNLKAKQAELDGERVELTNMGDAAGQRSQELERREQKVIDAEKTATELVQQAEKDRKTARAILEQAKDDIANNDARGDALNMKEAQLKNKEKALNDREVALNDRAGVLASH